MKYIKLLILIFITLSFCGCSNLPDGSDSNNNNVSTNISDIKDDVHGYIAYKQIMRSGNVSYLLFDMDHNIFWGFGAKSIRLREGTFSGDFESGMTIQYSDMDISYSITKANSFSNEIVFNDRTYKEADINSVMRRFDEINAALEQLGEYENILKEVGEIVEFGNYEQDENDDNEKEPIKWIVLDSQDDNRLLLSVYVLERLMYNDPNSTTNDIKVSWWEDSSLRTWLNKDFFETAFTEDEQKAIITTSVQEKLPEGNGTITTKDKVFLLSYDEAWKYLSTHELRKVIATPHASYLNGPDGYASWLLLTSESAARKMSVNNYGIITNPFYDEKDGVRPALWVKLSALSEQLS